MVPDTIISASISASGLLPGLPGGAPGQLKYEMLQGAWAVLPPDSKGIFDHDPATFWQDCISWLQGPRVIFD